MWSQLQRVVDRAIAQGDYVACFVHLGDQVYVDDEGGGRAVSTFGKWEALREGDDVRSLNAVWPTHWRAMVTDFQQVYRDTWMHGPTRGVLSSVPTIMMLPDDHEIVDD